MHLASLPFWLRSHTNLSLDASVGCGAYTFDQGLGIPACWAIRNTAHAEASVGTIGPPEPPPTNNGGPRTPPPPGATTARRESPAKGCRRVHPRAQPRGDVRGGVRKISAVQSRMKGRDTKATYPDHHRLVAFEFGDEFVPAEDLRFVEGPEPAHHFDAAFGWIRHLGTLQEGTRGWVGGRAGQCHRGGREPTAARS